MNTFKRILALFIIVLIPFALMLWYRLRHSTEFASNELIIYPLVFGSGFIILTVLVKKFFLKESLRDFNSEAGNIWKDIMWGVILTSIYFILFFIERPLLSNILEFRSNTELLGLMLDMREKPALLLLWFGPVLWIGIALYEELIRIFILTSLWNFSERRLWIFLVIIITSVLIGLTHWSQGPYGIVTIGIKSLVSCLYFYKFRRLLPLIIAHALYDGIQVALLLITYPV